MNNLVFEDVHVQSATGFQQGDPLGPLHFAAAVDDIDSSVKLPVNI